MYRLVANDHLDLLFQLSLHIFPLYKNEIQGCIIDLKFVGPLYDKLRSLRRYRFLHVNLKEVVAKFFLEFVGQDVELVIESLNSLYAADLVDFIEINLLTFLNVNP